ncbi:hypothetical protein L2K20_23240 [Mycobacterium sp. MBM]|nr:hypothetical protein [Mycobacterium sp. MBM]
MRVPDDLLGDLIGPMPYSSMWLWIAAALVVATACWYAGVFWFTAAGRTPGQPAVIGAARVALQRRRALGAIQTIRRRHRAGELTAPEAAAALGGHVRRFLHHVTGVRAEYVQVPHIPTIAGGVLAPAATVLAEVEDAQFNSRSGVDIQTVSDAAEDLVRGWT